MKSKLSDRIGSFTSIPNVFIENFTGTPKAKWLFVILRHYTNTKTEVAFPSYDELERISELHRRDIARSVRELIAAGWIERKRRFGGSTIYITKIPDSISANGGTNDENTISANGGTVISANGGTVISANGVHTNKTIELDDINKTILRVDAPALKPPRVPKANNPTKPKREPDPRSSSPEIQLFLEVTGHRPNLALYDTVIPLLAGRTVEQVNPFFVKWVSMGWNPNNLTWLTEWVASGKPASEFPERRNGNGHNKPTFEASVQSNLEAIQKHLRRKHG